jgi:pyridoxal phosphate enzyme (YggS family)
VIRYQINERALSIRKRIERAAERAGRSGADVTVLPITKGHSTDVLLAVAEAGFEAIGENRVAEAEAKLADVGRMGLRWHMVGHLQRNKAARAVRTFDVIESVDSLRLARRLQLDAERAESTAIPVLAQVNAGGEEQKSGLAPPEVVEAVGAMLELERLDVRGVMTLAPYTSDERVLRDTFAAARECLVRCQDELSGFRGAVLSMGMSNDFEIAVEEGSTEVRLGTVLLGERPEVRWN